MKLRQGKTKATLNASIDSALLAVEVYNKPRTSFRSEAYISLMIMAWTRLFHAHFNKEAIKYFEKDAAGNFIRIDDDGRKVKTGGEFRAWGLRDCIRKYKSKNALSLAVENNLRFFIGLRNKVEHRHIDKREIDIKIFGECQSMLNNYENLLIQIFGEEYAINESLVYSLQFSKLRTNQQKSSNRSVLSREMKDILNYIETFRTRLSDEVYGAQEYSIKLIQIPKIANTKRNDTAIEFVRWDELSDDDKESCEKILSIIKEKKVFVEGTNIKRLKAGEVCKRVVEVLKTVSFTQNLHVLLYKMFSIRPANGAEDPFETNTEFCLYDETHGDYVYEEAWVEFLIHFFQTNAYTAESLRLREKQNKKLNVEDFKI